MRIEWAIPCRYCEVVDNELYIVGGNAGAFAVSDLPTEIGVWVAMQLVAGAAETGPDVPHSFKGRVLDPQMNPIAGTELEIPDFRMAEPAMEGWEAEQVVPTYHVFEATELGTYTLDLQVDDRSKTLPILIFPPPEEDEETAD
jgi:hypothetical protein